MLLIYIIRVLIYFILLFDCLLGKYADTYVTTFNSKDPCTNYKIRRRSHFRNVFLVSLILICCLIKSPFMHVYELMSISPYSIDPFWLKIIPMESAIKK